MKRQPVGLIVVILPAVLLVTACKDRRVQDAGDTGRDAADAPAMAREGPYADTAAITMRVDSIDTQVKARRGRLELFALTSSDGALVRVASADAWPEDTEVSYNLFSNRAGDVLLHFESPVSESGDWSQSTTHYFDTVGNTILRKHYFAAFEPSGDSDITRVTIRTFLNPETGTVIAETCEVTDGNDRPVTARHRCGPDAASPPKRGLRELRTPPG